MFANTQGGGLNMAFPDVCNTPLPVGPVPIPYPNMSMPCTAVPTQFCVFVVCMPAHNMSTQTPLSNGDNPGVAMGIASGMVMGPTQHTTFSTAVFYSPMPSTRMLDITGQNGLSPNAIGCSLVPSQTLVMNLR